MTQRRFVLSGARLSHISHSFVYVAPVRSIGEFCTPTSCLSGSLRVPFFSCFARVTVSPTAIISFQHQKNNNVRCQNNGQNFVNKRAKRKTCQKARGDKKKKNVPKREACQKLAKQKRRAREKRAKLKRTTRTCHTQKEQHVRAIHRRTTRAPHKKHVLRPTKKTRATQKHTRHTHTTTGATHTNTGATHTTTRAIHKDKK